jgi:hypothetical protein
MSVYFCLDDLLDAVSNGPPGTSALDRFIPVTTTIPSCQGYREDALSLSSQPKMLDLNEHKGIYQLASLIEEVPLYQINLELLLDSALMQRHFNKLVDQALHDAFEGQPLPQTLEKENAEAEALEGTLSHPMLGHLDKVALCKIYVNFMKNLPHGHEDFSFARHVIGRHPEPFRERFSGYVFGQQGEVKADILIGFGVRVDFDPRRQIENYVENGRAKATLMRIHEKNEFLWAWLEADHYQMRRCHDIDRIMSLNGLPRIPNWVRTDIFNGLEKEAMKQVLAIRLIEEDPSLSLLSRHPAIRRAIEASAQGQIDESLQQLMAQTLTADTVYAGSADRFYRNALERVKEAKTL